MPLTRYGQPQPPARMPQGGLGSSRPYRIGPQPGGWQASTPMPTTDGMLTKPKPALGAFAPQQDPPAYEGLIKKPIMGPAPAQPPVQTPFSALGPPQVDPVMAVLPREVSRGEDMGGDRMEQIGSWLRRLGLGRRLFGMEEG